MRYNIVITICLALLTNTARLLAQSQESDVVASKTYVAVGTNVLADALLLPNAEVEVTSGTHVSVMAEWMSPWWHDDKSRNYLQGLNGGVEVRYWLDPTQGADHRWTPLYGHFVGMYLNVGRYDVEYHGEGYQSDGFFSIGVSYGYNFRLTRSLRLQCSVSIGTMYADNKHYVQQDILGDGKMYLVEKSHDDFLWFGPTKVKAGLVWIPQLTRRTKGDKR